MPLLRRMLWRLMRLNGLTSAEPECVGDCAGYTAVLSGRGAEAPENLQFSPWFRRNFSPEVPLLGGFSAS
jgi:hypothetical protein